MRKSTFRNTVKQLLLMTVEPLENYRNVPLRTKVRYLVDFLDDGEPEFRLLCALLLRSLLMEDFEAAWNTLTNRLRKLKFLDKVKLLLLDNSSSLAMRQVAIHVASITLRSKKLEKVMKLCFLDFMLTHVSSAPKQQENVLLLFFLVAPVMMNEPYIWRAFLSECLNITVFKNYSILSNQLAFGCIIFAKILEGKSDVDHILSNNPDYELIPRHLFKSLLRQELSTDVSDVKCGFEDGNDFRSIEPSRMTLKVKCCAQYGLVMSGIEKLDFIEMLVHADMQKRGIRVDWKPLHLFIAYFPSQILDMY